MIPCHPFVLKVLVISLDPDENPTGEALNDAFILFQLSRQVFYILQSMMMLLVNSIIYIDIYLIIKNPFYSRTKREKIYYVTLILMFACLAAYTVEEVRKYGQIKDLYLPD